jgi:N-acetylglucosaminyl-diphospho-decaprenol L-rhamnosyltransferase
MSELASLDPAVDVTVCVVNWNGAQWLPCCLESLRMVQGVREEVIVVDNASSDESVKSVRTMFPEMKLVVNNENRGFARGNNQAIRLARGRFFFILNNDTVLRAGCLESLILFLDEHAQAGMVAGHLENADGSTQFRYYPVALPSLASLTADLFWLNRLWPRNRLGRGKLARNWDPTRPYRMEQIPGACMLIRREALASVGLFDEAYSFWYEDVDLCARFRRAGWETWYLPDARILHHGGASSGLMDFSTRSLLRFRNMLRYGESYFTPARYRLLKLVVGLVLLLRLPIVMGASIWPSKEMNRLWGRGWRAYLQLLRELVVPSSARS